MARRAIQDDPTSMAGRPGRQPGPRRHGRSPRGRRPPAWIPRLISRAGQD